MSACAHEWAPPSDGLIQCLHCGLTVPMCVYCELPILEADPPFQALIWTEQRSQGGFHTLGGTVPTGQYAHKRPCFDHIKAGHARGQRQMF